MIFENYDRVVFAGDSVTDAGSFLPVGEGLADSLGHGYVRKVENLLGAFYPDVFVRVTNAGVSGNTSRDLLARFQRDVLNLKPEWVCICIGINDIWRQFDCPAMRDYHVYPEEYEENLRNMLSELAGKTKGIFLMTPFFIEENKQDRMRTRVDEYCSICKKLAEEYKCIFVDLQGRFDEYLTHKQYSGYVSGDRVHPNEVGATIIANEFLKHCEFSFDNL